MAIYSYDLQGKKDSFADWISNISPTDTFIVSYSKKEATPQPNYKWQTDALFPDVYKLDFIDEILEGSETPSIDKILLKKTVEKQGNTQIFKKTFAISDSALATSVHGRAGELKYQLEKAAKELKNVMEVVFSSKQKRQSAGTAGATNDTVPKTDGLFEQIAPKDQANPDLPSTVTPSAVHIESATANKVTWDEFTKVTHALYNAGSKACVLVTNPANATMISELAKEAETKIKQLQTFDKREPKQQYELPGGYDEQYSITDDLGCGWCVCFSRFCPPDLVYFLDPDTLTQRVLREPKATQLGKQGSFEIWQLVIEAGLCLSNPYAAGVIEIKQP